MTRPDAILFAISAPNLSKRRLAQMQTDLLAAADIPAMLIRLEDTGTSLPQALDALFDAGHRDILLQPLGMPFTESLMAWLPGAVANWRGDRGHIDVVVRVGSDISSDASTLAASVRWAIDNADTALPTAGVKPSLGKPGWQDPPDFTHHLLVCTGPRCQYRDAASLLHVLKDETTRQGIASQCLTARTGCLFPCNQGPMVALYPRGEWYRLPDAQSVARFVTRVLIAGQTLPDLLIHSVATKPIIPQPNQDIF